MVARQSEGAAVADVLRRADERQAAAHSVIAALDLLGRWARYGRPVLVGSVAHGLVVEPDIDVEIYCAQPRVEDGFAVVSALARDPGVWKVRFSNELEGPDCGLYWQVHYRGPAAQPGEVWKVDMWLLGEDHPGPRGIDLVEPMRQALTPETRAAILRIKEAFLGREWIHGIDVYRAVFDGGVRTPEAYEHWIAAHGPLGLTLWRP
jgi:hypothetical protein